ncbi:MAG TPA: YidC/Oxa1 family membrane protein insertase [Dehalococcoidia bacterium]|nr:YidC/Oxa1 family membrane protein insertase [Dehalococcoidia bacterium]
MTNLLVALARVFGGNFGIAIIIFTLGMRFATWPLTASQYRASRAMSALQPKVQELQKKYKGKDPKKLQAETMALYREAGVNPLGCVFPMLIQMPIWIALYQVIRLSLGTAPESLITLSQRLYPIPFVHTAVPLSNRLLIWDLGQPDTTYILPVIVGITMYVQQKMITPAPTAATANSQQAQTQQMMTWMMPLMFFIMSLNFPSGLALYWAVSQVAGIIMQYFYMGRTFDWKNMLTINPQPQQPQRRAPRPQPALVPAQDEEAEEHPAAAAGGARRKRHGRRRGKR